MSAEEWAGARKILCIRLDTIGDVLMTSPAMRALKRSGQDREITLLTSTVGADVARLIPEVDEVGVYDPPWMKATALRDDGDSDRAMIERIRRQHFDAAVIFTVYSQSAQPAALLTALADIPLRLAHCRENPYSLLTDWIREPEPEDFVRHEVRRHLDLVGAVGCTTPDERLSMLVPPAAYVRVRSLLRPLGIDPPRPLAVVHVGASAPSRRYPGRKFGEAARMLAEEHGVQVVFTGSKKEASLAEEALAEAGSGISLAGLLDLADLSALVSMADVVVSNNSAPAHIAAAVQTPVVDLYALTNPQHTPWQVPARVLFHDTDCKYCYRSLCPLAHHACLDNVSPRDVAAAAIELLEETSRRERREITAPVAGMPLVTDSAVAASVGAST